MTPAPIIQPSGHSSNQQNVRNDLTSEESVELKKPFGATARIEKKALGLTDMQHAYLNTFIAQYSLKTNRSKSYTQENRPHMADPRVVSGFTPDTKEIVYSIVVNQSKGCRLWDIDGNEYIDVLNGFGRSDELRVGKECGSPCESVWCSDD